MFFVHRLAAMTFLKNPNNLPEVNHKDEDKTNNVVNNLEYCTSKYNINYGTCIKRRVEKRSTKIKCLDLEKNETKYYDSINAAALQMKVSSTAIRRSIYKYKSPYKKRFIFSEDK